MKKIYYGFLMLIMLIILTGCNSIGDKSTCMSVIYAATSFISLIMLVGYCVLIKKKEFWFYVLFVSVFIVNIGYLTLSLSKTLEQALFFNRVAYFGSVFLPLAMIMIIMKVSGLSYKKWLPYVLGTISVIIFLIAASPGYLDIYYKNVTLEYINGVSVLNKEYGSWHSLYLFYLLACFGAMVSIIIHAASNKKLESTAHAAVLLVATLGNICVWMLEQLVKIDFEFLSVSYIISEAFLIGAYLMIQHQEVLISSLRAKLEAPQNRSRSDVKKDSPEFIQQCEYLAEQLQYLTRTERMIYDCYLAGKSTKEVLEEMNIAENTLKFHNKNIYGKLGVSSRKQLIECAKSITSSK